MTTKYLDSSGLSYFWGKLKNKFQDKLVSGTNIKTINNESVLGSGNITIQGGGSSTDVMIVTLTEDFSDPDNPGLVADKTFDEITAALLDGKLVFGILPVVDVDDIYATDTFRVEQCSLDGTAYLRFCQSAQYGWNYLHIIEILMYDDDSLEVNHYQAPLVLDDGEEGQVLTKVSSGSLDYEWADPPVFVATKDVTTQYDLQTAIQDEKIIGVRENSNSEVMPAVCDYLTISQVDTVVYVRTYQYDLVNGWKLVTYEVDDNDNWTTSTDKIQLKLVSGTNIKTINNESLLGSGDITVTSGTQVQIVRW